MSVLTEPVGHLTSLDCWVDGGEDFGSSNDGACHASILDFGQLRDTVGNLIDSFCGFRYWMATSTSEVYGLENINLYATNEPPSSTQGWTAIICVEAGQDSDGFADPELVYDPVGNKIRCYYVHDSNDPLLLRTYGASGLSAQVISISTAQVPSLLVSPTIIRESATKWNLWAGGGETPQSSLVYYHSTDGLAWIYGGMVDNAVFAAAYPGVDSQGNPIHPWHLEGRVNPAIPSQVEFVFCTYASTLYHFSCLLSSPTVLHFPLAPVPLLNLVTHYAYYRSSFILENQTGNIFIRLYADPWINDSNGFEIFEVAYTEGILGSIATLHLTPPAVIPKRGIFGKGGCISPRMAGIVGSIAFAGSDAEISRRKMIKYFACLVATIPLPGIPQSQ
jgi:hypothetical protein